MAMNMETIGAMLAKIGGYMGKKFSLDSQGVLALSYMGNRSCVFVAQNGVCPRIGMVAPLVSAGTKEQIARAAAMNANFDRDSGLLALDANGSLVLTAARDAADLTEDTLASFLSDFIMVASELCDVFQASSEAGNGADLLSQLGDHVIRG